MNKNKLKLKRRNTYKKNDTVKKPKLIAVLGQTATGKTDLAIKLAKKYNGEIVNADSRAFYKEMTVGTAKPIKDKKISKKHKWIKKFKKYGPIISKNILHWLIDFETIDDPLSAGVYKKMADNVIEEILSRGKIPIIVGGSGLYAAIILNGFQIPQIKPDNELRKKLDSFSVEKLADKFKKLDSEAAKQIDLKNKRRLIRAIEIVSKSKKPFSFNLKKEKPKFEVLKIAPEIEKSELDEKIYQRTEQMIEKGWLSEVEKLYLKGLHKTQIFKNTIGYPQLLEVLRNKNTLYQATEEIKLRTRQFAKRQKTWFKKEEGLKWFKTYYQADILVKRFLKK